MSSCHQFCFAHNEGEQQGLGEQLIPTLELLLQTRTHGSGARRTRVYTVVSKEIKRWTHSNYIIAWCNCNCTTTGDTSAVWAAPDNLQDECTWIPRTYGHHPPQGDTSQWSTERRRLQLGAARCGPVRRGPVQRNTKLLTTTLATSGAVHQRRRHHCEASEEQAPS